MSKPSMPPQSTSTTPEWLLQIFPFLRWMGELKDPKILSADVISGITVALILIPQAMAYAQLAGLPSYYGLYTAFLPPIIAVLWGSSRQLATGPVAMVALLTAAALAPLANRGVDIIPVAILLSFCTGLIQLMMGVFRMGGLFSFVSFPVLLGLTNAAAIIIATSQLDKFFGVDVSKADQHLVTVWRVIYTAISEGIFWPALAMGMGSLVVMFGCRRISKKIPAVLLAVALCAGISWGTNYDAHSYAQAQAQAQAQTEGGTQPGETTTEQTGRVVGGVPKGLPDFALPSIDWDIILELWGPILVIAFIGFAEPLAISKTMALQTRHRHDANQELVGQGLAKIAGSFTQAFPCSGSYSRSAVNLTSGGKTGFSSVITSTAVVVCLLWLTPLLWHIPEATLAAVIFMAVSSLIQFKPFVYAWKVSKSDALTASVTCIATLLAAPHLEIGILTGVAMSIVVYLWETSHPHLAVLARHWDGSLKDAVVNKCETSPYILAIRLDARLYFANTSSIEDRITEMVIAQPSLKVVLLFAGGINNIDSTGEAAVVRLSELFAEQGIKLLIVGAKRTLREALHHGSWVEQFGQDSLIANEMEAIERAHKMMNDVHRDSCPLIHHRPLHKGIAENI